MARPRSRWGDNPRSTSGYLVHRVRIEVKSLAEQGRAFPWPRPVVCLGCGGARVWGHGFVEAWFDGYDRPLTLRRYRCPQCRLVIRMRPFAYWQRFQASTAAIRVALLQRLRHGRWPPQLSTARARHWLRALRRRVVVALGMQWRGRLLKGFNTLYARGICAVSRSVLSEPDITAAAPYR